PVAPPVFLDSANTTSRRMGFQGHVDIMGVRFQEGGAFPFLQVPLIDLQNELNLLDRLDDASLFQLHSRLCEATAMPTRIGLLEGWLMKQLSLGVARSGLIPESLARLRKEIALLRQGFGLSSIPKVADDLAISERQLEHLYRSQVGMTPKQYVRLQRIECARLALSHEKQPNAQLAAALGFYDQAHFIREFRAIIGVTPSAYMRRKHRDAAGRVVRGAGHS
ncbi:MAG TPA: helix-turn-helix transcriptional regulator, partial [Terriglobales bacterium]